MSLTTDKSEEYLVSVGDLGLKPDLVDIETREVWEIKTTRGYVLGLADITLYLSILNASRDKGSPPWRIGKSYSPPPTARGFLRTATVYPAVSGVITYDPYISTEVGAGMLVLGIAAKASAVMLHSLMQSFGTAIAARY